jgi:uncharacterized protein (DUF2126 family)
LPNAPYGNEAWKGVVACGRAVEASLERTGVRLTMGGEPTFVPQRPHGAEWRTDALGPTKLGYARRLAHQLVRAEFPGAVLVETSGKHYPGEPLPRWALLIQRRTDGQPLWRHVRRLRADTEPGTHSRRVSGKLLRAVARALELDAGGVLSLVEAHAPKTVVGHVLPLDHDGSGWVTDDWTRSVGARPLSLLSGDSLAGLRLPLAELGDEGLRRALTAEVREGTLTIFLPPLLLPGYVALLEAIETSLERLDLEDVVLAGYAPPHDHALPTIGLASDPGVLEVNLWPCAGWAEYDAQLEQVYAAAHAIGLTARKLQFTGREVGTGGGAHLVFGGRTGPTSPFFTFPALPPSLVRYWQRHPALSYAFAGGFLGPSSQAPRIDESTFEALYELEIACAGAETMGSSKDLPLFDLLFRDLLMDRSGNTHRAEISVDKLWNPFAPNGRLGLVELRAFETHPSRAVQSVTALFVRAIIARLAAAPCREPFVRWGGELHDRFFLPAFIREDLRSICEDLASHGIAFDADWLTAQWEFRFPRLGALTVVDEGAGPFTIEVRQALEAWPLLGESPNAGTVARTVDSSSDRIEARVQDARVLQGGLLLVNGLPCEFRPTSDGGAACGIRYRAFDLTPSLQPHVPVHAPLLIEWVDRAASVVVAAARWHAWNRGGVAYEAPPTDEVTAADRRAERWEPWSATVGQPRSVPRIELPPEGRHTLDLRRYPAQAR